MKQRYVTYPICGVLPRPFSKAFRRARRHPRRSRLAAHRSSSVQLPDAAPSNVAATDVVTAAAATRRRSSRGDELGARAMVRETEEGLSD
jgi:hypothetical protein